MAELLHNHLGVNAAPVETGDKEEKWKGKREQVKNILEWLQCYRMYIAVVAVKYPQRLPNMLGYQVLIIEAHMEYEGEEWLLCQMPCGPGLSLRFGTLRSLGKQGQPAVRIASV